jgi:hypothetical protein
MRIKNMSKEEARTIIKWLTYPDAPAIHPQLARDLFETAELPIPEYLQQKPLAKPEIIWERIKNELISTRE